MTNTENTNYQEMAKKNLEKVGRAQTLRAMEHIIIAMGSKDAYAAWLQTLPEDATLSATGRLSNDAINLIIAEDDLYNNAVKAFAQQMAPVLESLGAMA